MNNKKQRITLNYEDGSKIDFFKCEKCKENLTSNIFHICNICSDKELNIVTKIEEGKKITFVMHDREG